ncbi:MAG: Veg family protein [Clostridia bacterium]|nr:Veg family protein [Clostridia bacterium]
MIISSDVDICKNKLISLIGHRIRLTSNGGRKRLIVNDGIVDGCYDNFFNVKCLKKDGKTYELVSFSYIDVLTKNVRVVVPVSNSDEASA